MARVFFSLRFPAETHFRAKISAIRATNDMKTFHTTVCFHKGDTTMKKTLIATAALAAGMAFAAFADEAADK